MEPASDNGANCPPKAEYAVEGTTLRVSGQLDSGEEEEFRLRGLEIAAGSDAEVILDLAGVSYISSSCLGTILVLHEELSKKGRALKIRLPQTLLYVYDLMGIRNVVDTEITGQ